MACDEFKDARNFLLDVREEYEFARVTFRWPRPK